MARLPLIALFLALSFIGTVNTASQASDVRVRSLEAQRLHAMVQRNFAVLHQLFSDDLRYVHGSGAVDTKTSLIAALRRRDLVYLSFPVTDVQVRMYGDTAVFTGNATPEFRLRNTEPQRVYIRFLGVWVRTAAHGWQMTAWESTPVR